MSGVDEVRLGSWSTFILGFSVVFLLREFTKLVFNNVFEKDVEGALVLFFSSVLEKRYSRTIYDRNNSLSISGTNHLHGLSEHVEVCCRLPAHLRYIYTHGHDVVYTI